MILYHYVVVLEHVFLLSFFRFWDGLLGVDFTLFGMMFGLCLVGFGLFGLFGWVLTLKPT